ncbi:hypothetical protein CRE_29556 [Caenorhabditis remanei]|uniref:Uncharacterized protein n=2 Tax=Caenorhabditis remanei TaxID=31234 RepID=E3LVN4_CAERE|nr:hypothetical protein CRE_29556 [Caenorhabditis remanei]
MAGADVEKLLKEEHIKVDDLLTDGPNNRLNLQIHTDDTTVGNTKGGKKSKYRKASRRVHRTMVITKHEDVLPVFLPIVSFCGALLLFIQSLIAIAILFTPFPSN